MRDYPIRFTKDGFHQYRNDYKKSSIQGTHVTFEEGCTHALTVAHVPMVLEDIEKESDNLTKSSEKGVGSLSGIKRCEATLEKVRKFYEDNGYMPEFYNPYNNVEITDITPTLTANCDRITNSATVLVFENELKESDNLTNSIKGYGADEQADFTQTEAEEWAAEIALRIQEGNLDPIPTNKPKKFEQFDFTYASLFSGIGGFEQALNNFGGQCVFASEIDKFAAQAYETLYGHKPTGDIMQVDAKDVPDHDLLVGGFPCQSFSVAGKRKGFEDTRGTLFFEIARIAKEKRPKALLLENVKGLVNHDKGRTLDVMIETLNEIGYVIDFDVLNSKYFGVPQNRERIFIIAIREDLIEAEPFGEEATKGNTIVPKGKRRIGEWAKTFNFDWPSQDAVVTRLRDVLETEVDEKYYLDDEKTAKLVSQLEERDQIDGELPLPINRVSRGPETRTDETSYCLRAAGGTYQMAHLLESEPQMSDKRDVEEKYYLDEEKTAKLVTQLEGQGLPIREATKKGYTIAEEGDSVNVQFPGSKTRRGRVGKQIANTLEASSINQGTPVKEGTRYRIRKLTPKECWRLQGFTDEAHDAVMNAGISDSQRYRQSGNAVTVNVIEAIGQRLIPLITSD